MASTRKTWISILIAAVIIVGILALTVVGGTAFFIYRHVNTELTSERTAAQEFAAARARFADQNPLIEVRRGDEPVLHKELLPGTRASATPLQSLRVLAYDENVGKLVRIRIPFWLLRLMPTRHLLMLNDEGIDVDIDAERVRLTLEDLERRGPGLVLDQQDRHGSKVLVWTE